MSQGLENLKPHFIETEEMRGVTIVVGATGTYGFRSQISLK